MQISLNKSPFWLETTPVAFPPSHLALQEPNGLLAIGGDLTPEWLLQAYSLGIFPWFNPDEPVLWWTPNPRSVLFIDHLKITRSLKKTLNQIQKTGRLTVTLDQNFKEVMTACANIPRNKQDGSWITSDMINAYYQLHQSGHAHSVEVWQDKQLVGGLYGIAIGKMFFGESMFSTVSDSSKIALVALSMQLKEWGFKVMDTQVETPHLNRLGATQIDRTVFERLVAQQIQHPFPAQKWHFSLDWFSAAHTHQKNAKKQA